MSAQRRGLADVRPPRRSVAPPPRATTATPSPAPAPAPASAIDYSTGKGAEGTDAFWDSLKWDQSQLDKQYGYSKEEVEASQAAGGDSVLNNDNFGNLGSYYAIASNFGETPGEGKLGYGMSANLPELTSQYGSLGSQGGIVPVAGKPGYYTMTRQPAGNKSYNLVQAEYKVGADGKTLDRVSDWTPISKQSDTKMWQHSARAAAAVFGAGAVGQAMGLGGAAGAEGAGAAGGLAEGAGALAPEAGMGIGEIGASQLTPALAESAVGSSGYGLSSAGLGYVGPAAGAGGVAGFNTAATNPALIDSALGTSGYGASSAGAGGGAGGLSLTPDQWKQLGQQASKFGDSGGQGGGGGYGGPITGVDLAALAALQAQAERDRETMALSTKKAKTAAHGGLSMARGLRSQDPIDTNGVHIAAIKEMTKELAACKQRLAKLKAARGKEH